MIKCGVYSITNNINGKIYVGSSKNITTRWKQHRNHLNKGMHHSKHLQRAWLNYGEDNFTFEVIEEVIKEDELLAREQFYLNTIKPFNMESGYNCYKDARSSAGSAVTEESREKMRKAKLGSKLSSETKLKMSESRKGKPSGMLGRKHTEETKRLMRQNNAQSFLGKTHSEETKHTISRKISNLVKGENNPFYNRHHSEESKRKISLSRRQKLSDHNVIEIKNLYSSGIKQKDIAVRFNITASLVSMIITGKRYSSVRNSYE